MTPHPRITIHPSRDVQGLPRGGHSNIHTGPPHGMTLAWHWVASPRPVPSHPPLHWGNPQTQMSLPRECTRETKGNALCRPSGEDPKFKTAKLWRIFAGILQAVFEVTRQDVARGLPSRANDTPKSPLTARKSAPSPHTTVWPLEGERLFLKLALSQ